MAARLTTTAYGRPASVALHAELAAAKHDDPLAPVTVVVPANSVGVAARRLLASGGLGPVGPGRGVVGVSFLTVLRLAELLAAARLAAQGRRPVSTSVVAAAVRAVLADRPGLFRPVAAHPATEEAIVAVHRELSDLGDAELDVLAAQSPRAREVVRVHRAVTARLAPGWYAEHDLMRAAVEVVASGGPLVTQLGRVVVHLPQRLTTPAARLLRALADATDVVVVAGLTGDARADEAVVAAVGALGCKLADDAAAAVTRPAGTRVLSVSDPDDEVRHVVREVVDAMRAGVPLERMAVVYAAREPYARLLHEHLALAGVEHNGGAVRTLRDSVLGASLLRMLALTDRGFRRDDVLALLACAPVRHASDSWERISRVAGVVGGLAEWRARLDGYAARLEPEGWGAREGARVARLRRFVDELAADLDPGRAGDSWSAKAAWAQRLVHRWLGDEPARERADWPPLEQDAARRVEAALDRLAGLDAVERAPSLDVFRRTLELELTHAHERVGRLGEGLLVGPVSFALGVELDRLFVCGLAEGTFPAIPRDDPLLADPERSALGGELPLRSARVADDHRALLAALAATSGERVLCFPRGDLRRTTARVPSRYLLDTAEALGGPREVTAGEWCTEVASFLQGLSHVPFPATAHEHDVRAALAGAPADAPELRRAVELVRARRGAAFTRFDGNLAHLRERLAPRSPAGGAATVSATRLERWVACPHAYFARYLLGVEPVERPEETVQITPIDRGALVHRVLDRFVREGGRAGDRARLHALLDEECAETERRGLAGRRVLWRRDRMLLHAELDAWLTADARYREDRGLETLATELPFTGVEVALPDGRTLRFRGAADRVDRARDGRLVVIDYKTGRPDGYRGLGPDDPLHGGARLQLPLYAYAAREVFGAPGDVVEAHYWFVGRGEDEWIGYVVDEAVDAELCETLQAIVDGIDCGCFPSRPAPPGPRPWVDCHYCDPDGLGTADRWREWERKQDAPDLAPYLAIVAGEDE